MDEKTFMEEVWDQVMPCRPMAHFQSYMGWRNSQAAPAPNSIDYQLVQAALTLEADTVRDFDPIVPGFRQRISDYRVLQGLLLNDLQIIKKQTAKSLHLFKNYL